MYLIILLTSTCIFLRSLASSQWIFSPTNCDVFQRK